MKALGESLDSDQETDQKLMEGVVSGAREYLETGDIQETWGHLRRYPHVNTVLTCLKRAKNCN